MSGSTQSVAATLWSVVQGVESWQRVMVIPLSARSILKEPLASDRLLHPDRGQGDTMEFDLLSMLPLLLPDAIVWAELQSERAAKQGDSLNVPGVLLARAGGVPTPS